MSIYQFNSDDAFAFAREQGIKTKIKDEELHLYDCPYCHGATHGDKHTFSINLPFAKKIVVDCVNEIERITERHS